MLAVLAALSLASAAAAQSVTRIVPDGKPHKFEARDQKFFIDGDPTMIVAGEMHFGRVLPEDWETRIRQAKAMGLNTVSFYLFWNMVEPREGEFVFTGMTDVRRVLKLCADNGLWAILRPGPYCCAEVEYGGIPWWTAKYPDVKIRSADPKWLEWSRRYLAKVHEQVADLDVSKGGPLLMVQVENEIGITAPADNTYMVALTKVFRDVGFGGQLFTCNPSVGGEWRDPAYRMPGVLSARNGLRNDRDLEQTLTAANGMPAFAPEIYTAWFSGWGQPIATRYAGVEQARTWSTYLLDHNVSYCYYMFFGGTTFGFFNGTNEYLPVQTSYDYSAPVDEAGRTTEKYRMIRQLLTDKLKIAPPPIPAEPAVAALPVIALKEQQALLDTLPAKPTRLSAKPLAMEELDQAYGLVLYRKKFAAGVKGTLELRDAMDYAVVMVNGRTVGKSFRGYGPESARIELNETGPVTLDVLVYNLGRISVVVSERSQNRARKGLIGGAWLSGAELTGWENFSLPMENPKVTKTSTAALTGPALHRGTFTVAEPAGTFLDLRNWGFGAVWVNGHNLGRYWDRGALRSLFVPSHWLKRGENEIVVLELHDSPKTAEIASGTKIIEEPAVAFAVRLDRADAPPPRPVPAAN